MTITFQPYLACLIIAFSVYSTIAAFCHLCDFKVKPINYLKSVNFNNWNEQNFRQSNRDPSIGDRTCDRRPLILNHAIERGFSRVGSWGRVECTSNMASQEGCLVQNCKDDAVVHDHVQEYVGGGGSK